MVQIKSFKLCAYAEALHLCVTAMVEQGLRKHFEPS